MVAATAFAPSLWSGVDVKDRSPTDPSRIVGASHACVVSPYSGRSAGVSAGADLTDFGLLDPHWVDVSPSALPPGRPGQVCVLSGGGPMCPLRFLRRTSRAGHAREHAARGPLALLLAVGNTWGVLVGHDADYARRPAGPSDERAMDRHSAWTG
jgi:hypothetical protein